MPERKRHLQRPFKVAGIVSKRRFTGWSPSWTSTPNMRAFSDLLLAAPPALFAHTVCRWSWVTRSKLSAICTKSPPCKQAWSSKFDMMSRYLRLEVCRFLALTSTASQHMSILWTQHRLLKFSPPQKIDKAKLPNAKERPRSWRRAQRASSWNLPAKIKGYKKATLTLHEQLVQWCFWPMAKPNTKIEVPCANMFHSKWCQSISFYSTSTHVLGRRA